MKTDLGAGLRLSEAAPVTFFNYKMSCAIGMLDSASAKTSFSAKKWFCIFRLKLLETTY
jgi:hypothetical protein